MNRQSGFTIVEIMVALTVSMLLIAGVAQVFSGNRETYRLQSGLGNLQENARFAVDWLRRDLSMAGYPGEQNLAPFDSAKSGEGGGNIPDTVSVRYETERDCVGGGIPKQVLPRTYSVFTDPITKVSSLQCNGVSVVDGVENMQVLYGIDTDTVKTDYLPNKYVTANLLTAEDWQKHVVAVRFALLLNTLEPVSREPDTSSFILLDAPTIPAANDLLRRRIYFGTVAVRNHDTTGGM